MNFLTRLFGRSSSAPEPHDLTLPPRESLLDMFGQPPTMVSISAEGETNFPRVDDPQTDAWLNQEMGRIAAEQQARR